MVYVDKGRLIQQRSAWSLRTITDAFWAVLSAITFFVHTLVSPGAPAQYKKATNRRPPSSGSKGKPSGSGSAGARITGMQNLRNNSKASAAAGGC